MIQHDLGWEDDQPEDTVLTINDALIEMAIRDLRNFQVNCLEDNDTLDKMEMDLEKLHSIRARIISTMEDKRESSIDPYID